MFDPRLKAFFETLIEDLLTTPEGAGAASDFNGVVNEPQAIHGCLKMLIANLNHPSASAIQSNWKRVSQYATPRGLLRKFEGDAELKAELLKFLNYAG